VCVCVCVWFWNLSSICLVHNSTSPH
jgi:hypothetical protein